MSQRSIRVQIFLLLGVLVLPLDSAWSATPTCDTARSAAQCIRAKNCYWHNSRGGKIIWPFKNYDDGGADNRFVCANAPGKMGDGSNGCCLPIAAKQSVMTLNDFLKNALGNSIPEEELQGELDDENGAVTNPQLESPTTDPATVSRLRRTFRN